MNTSSISQSLTWGWRWGGPLISFYFIDLFIYTFCWFVCVYLILFLWNGGGGVISSCRICKNVSCCVLRRGHDGLDISKNINTENGVYVTGTGVLNYRRFRCKF